MEPGFEKMTLSCHLFVFLLSFAGLLAKILISQPRKISQDEL